MNLADYSSHFAYLAVFVAAVVEGEVVFVSACVLASAGLLNPWSVWIAGALGGSAGDQFFFYALRGRLARWLSRFPRWFRRQEEVLAQVREHSNGLILACRFLPGLRIAIPAACACAGVSAARFSALSLVGSLAWSGVILFLIAHVGPEAFAQLELKGWWTPLLPALLILGIFVWLGRRSRSLLSPPAERNKETA